MNYLTFSLRTRLGFQSIRDPILHLGRVKVRLARIEIEREAIQDTDGKFNVLVLVDGEKAVIESIDDPSARYTMGYLDMVVVPASLGGYRIRNLGNHQICIHKTRLKDDYRSSI